MKQIARIVIISLLMVCVTLPEPVAAITASVENAQTKRKKTKKKRSGSKSRTADDVRRERQRNEGAIKKTREQIEHNIAETEKRLNQLDLLEGEIAECNVTLKKQRASLDSINRSIKIAGDSINALDNRLEAIKQKYIKAVRRTQGHRSNKGALAFVFSSESFSQAYRRMRSVRQFSKWRQRRSKEIAALRGELDNRRSELEKIKKNASVTIARIDKEKKTLQQKQNETGKLVNRLRKKGGELKEIMSRRRKEAESLDAELDRIIAEEAARQERLRREREEAERKERERKAREAEEARKEAERQAELMRLAEEEAKAARAAEERAEAARKAEQEAARKAAEAEKKARETADKEARELAKRERKAAEKAEKARVKAEKEAAEKARKAEEKAKKSRDRMPVKHKGKNNLRGKNNEPETDRSAPTLQAPVAAGKSAIAPETEIPAGGDFEYYRGKLPFPVEGRYTIVKRFGRQQHPTLPHVVTTNSGIDMQTAPGASVRSVFDGEVSAVFRPSGYNNVVVIRHGSYMTVYANLGSINVSTGQKVKAGQSIGTVYSDSNDGNRSILHFEIRNRKAKENPELWLKK